MKKIRFAIIQDNFVVGGIDENLEKCFNSIKKSYEFNPDFIVFPELAITGYPPEDLLLRQSFIQKNLEAIQELADFTRNRDEIVIVGFVDMKDDLYNSAAIIQNGKMLGIYHKILLPNYGVFDEKRYFMAGKRPMILEVNGTKIGISICEDIWAPDGPTMIEANNGAMILINISSSPYNIMKGNSREMMVSTRASDFKTAVVYANIVGGQDELVFDGHSFVTDEMGKTIARAGDFKEEILVADVDIPNIVNANLHDPRRRERSENKADLDFINAQIKEKERRSLPCNISKSLCVEEEIFEALKLGTKDYVIKNGFKKVLIGLSGGIDSSIVAVIAREALGADNVIGVMMPSMYSSNSSIEDAQALAENLGIKTLTMRITDVYNSYMEVLKESFKATGPNIAEENLQARIRGNYLMALSNKFGWLVLTTGNKSEMSTGYATLYGDMAGGFAVIKDLYKTMVYKVCAWYNSNTGRDIIPSNIFIKPPSAELKPNQVDQDTLPPYDVLDKILELYVEKDLSLEEITEMGFDFETVKKTMRLVDSSEYKRRQAPPGVKITFRAFGRDRRLPITNHFRR